ncbi:hypothetical protein C8F04DRAFT_1184636 [Mycena alexandri]|uniref:DUF6699 domain-containing protein n=1 Tax=Mycena alexandri TaxID=1745969 RepID=A0AAD6SRW0_9AGAR|nr:hypothetical protein C8F04DRAFT_1184636 [Mycena alexandri]
MPQKHVRFSVEDTFYSPISSCLTPLGPSRTMVSPPPDYAPLPGPTPFTPESYIESTIKAPQLHRLLAVSDSPFVTYDISRHPSTISTHHPGLSCLGLLEPAVVPRRPTITLTTPYLPWPIVVEGSKGHFVTVSDVLDSIYASLRTNITPAEFQALGTREHQRRATEAYTLRYGRLHGQPGYEDEKRQGVKRVDFLMGYTRFQGLSAAGSAGVWQLHTS